MAAPREKQRVEQLDDDPSLSVSKLRLRAEARQRRLLLSSASRRLQVLGGSLPGDEGISATRKVQNCAANCERQELRSASPVHYYPTASGDGSASGDQDVRRGPYTEVITTPRSQHVQGAPSVVGGSPCGAQHSSSTTAEVLPDGAATNRLNVKPTLGLERETCLRREADGSISYTNGDFWGKPTCPAHKRTLVSLVKFTKRIHAPSKYLAPNLLGYIRRRLGILLTAALTALHANLLLLRLVHVLGFAVLAVISALLPCAVLPEDLTSTAVPTPESAAVPGIASRRLRYFLWRMFLCFAGQPLVCVLCATCGLILVEHTPAVLKHAPTVVKQAVSAEDDDHKVSDLHDSRTSPREQTRHSAGELLQHHERPEEPAAPASHPVVCSNGSRENSRAAGTQRSGIGSRVNLLHALLSHVFFVFQCYATLLRVLQQLAVFVALHCIIRTVLVQMALLAGCIEQQLRPVEGSSSTG